MGLVAGGLQSGGGTASTLGPGATGTTLVLSGAATALQFISTQAAGSDAFKVNTNGARWHVGAGASDYFSSDGTTITFAGPIDTTTGGIVANTVGRSGNCQISFVPNAVTISGSGSITLSHQTTFAADAVFSSYTDDSATPGNRTVNKVRGKSAVAIGASTVTITNSFVTANSQIICTLEFVDATATFIRTCIPGPGSFILTVNANATAATKFSWVVIN